METAMKDDLENAGQQAAGPAGAPGLPPVADRATFQAELDRLRAREKAHTREGDAIAAARRRLPMAEVDAGLALTGPHGAASAGVAGRTPDRPVARLEAGRSDDLAGN
jgi:hypothetical protein